VNPGERWPALFGKRVAAADNPVSLVASLPILTRATLKRTADERWTLIRAAMEDQASGAMHVDPGTKDYKYTRAEVEGLIAMTAALLCIMP